MLNGCGYSLHSYESLPFKEIWVGTIENRTSEPGLQDMLHRAVVEEFSKQGINVNPAAKLKISGTINTFDMPSISEKNDIATEYRIVIDADFRVTDENGKTEYIKHISSPFIEPFTGSADLGTLLATKTVAVDLALRDMAMRLMGALIYK